MLVQKGYIYPTASEDGSPHVSSKWESFFQTIEDEFPEFWTIDTGEKDGEGKAIRGNGWPGSKTMALKLYTEQRNKHSKEYLIERRDLYFEYLKLERTVKKFDRAKMMCTVFLGKQERFEEKWEDYIKEIQTYAKKIKDEEYLPESIKPSTRSKTDRKKDYEDTNQ